MLPGGLDELRRVIGVLHEEGVKALWPLMVRGQSARPTQHKSACPRQQKSTRVWARQQLQEPCGLHEWREDVCEESA
eukprot:442158-Pleurochrysis_carterae.AAC.1